VTCFLFVRRLLAGVLHGPIVDWGWLGTSNLILACGLESGSSYIKSQLGIARVFEMINFYPSHQGSNPVCDIFASCNPIVD
jgi:hypothetical protein